MSMQSDDWIKLLIHYLKTSFLPPNLYSNFLRQKNHMQFVNKMCLPLIARLYAKLYVTYTLFCAHDDSKFLVRHLIQ